MENLDKNYNKGLDLQPAAAVLSVFCFDTVDVKARVTFDSETVDGIQITYWMDDDRDIEKGINCMFDLLFNEVYKTIERGKKSKDI